MIYLDNAATSFPKPERVYVEMDKCMRQYCANPGRSGHRLALEAGRAIYRTRERLCRLFNIESPMQVVFTSNATEALNLGIKGLLKEGDHVVTTSMEHNSVARPLTVLKAKGVRVTYVRCDSKGYLNPKDIERAIKKNTALIVITHASNVTGTLMPVKEVGCIAKEKGIPFMLDAAQTAGIYDIDVRDMNIDILAFPGHKGLMGPQGTGGLYISESLDVLQMKEGGTGSRSEELDQPTMVPDRYESGTPNTAGIVGLGEGVAFILEKGTAAIREHEEELTGMLLQGLEQIKGVKIYGPADPRLQAGVVSINIGDGDSGEISYILDRSYGIATRSGLHCSPLAHRTIGTFDQGTVRFSIGYFNTREDIEAAVRAVEEIAAEIV
ncbi:MAG TPA: aminotransferase class V-fold PLP-dependent enzyme [Clostridia bacterium]|jgi:cysteine desulfurase/selenocysteine lyase|nr:aminotransferase class V-fold PLP-dependent enzyme [Clostridia bacterium]